MAQHVDPNCWRGTVRGRLLVVALGFFVWVLAIQVRLVFVQVVERQHWVDWANSQQTRSIDLPARRGDILDRNGVLLATSVEVPRLYADPKLALDPKAPPRKRVKADPEAAAKKHPRDAEAAVATLCAALEDCSREEVRALVRQFNPQSQYVKIRERLSLQQAERIRELDLPWVGLEPRPWRLYPNRELLAHVLGAVSNVDSRGLAGLELKYDEPYLRGRPSKQVVLRTLNGIALSRVGAPPVPGDTLELTIDSYIQFKTEQALRQAVSEHRADGGCAIVMETHSGELLAMVSLPDFNPNERYGEISPERQRNRAVQDAYEPGSTFKVITAAAALEQKVVRPDDLIETGNGSMRIGGYTIRDTHAHGTMTFREVITKSSNVGAMQVGQRLGAARLGQYVRLLGFGRRATDQFSGEQPGLVWDPAQWSEMTTSTVSYGYGLSVTAMQLTAALNAIANGGELVQPRVLRAVIRGNTRLVTERKVLRRAILPETAAQLIDIMEGVTEKGGTATAAKIEGFTVAGKTGTARKNVNGHYTSAYNSSFVGFFPSRSPAVTIMVMLDTPRQGGYYGGAVAAPAFKLIGEAVARRLAIPPSVDPGLPVIVAPPRQTINVAGPIQPLTIVPARPLGEGELLLPELHGMSGRAALLALSRLGIAARMTGDGVVTAQEPAAGTPMEPGSSCRLWLTRVVPNPPPGTRP